jgi:hypothetical protein
MKEKNLEGKPETNLPAMKILIKKCPHIQRKFFAQVSDPNSFGHFRKT